MSKSVYVSETPRVECCSFRFVSVRPVDCLFEINIFFLFFAIDRLIEPTMNILDLEAEDPSPSCPMKMPSVSLGDVIMCMCVEDV